MTTLPNPAGGGNGDDVPNPLFALLTLAIRRNQEEPIRTFDSGAVMAAPKGIPLLLSNAYEFTARALSSAWFMWRYPPGTCEMMAALAPGHREACERADSCWRAAEFPLAAGIEPGENCAFREAMNAVWRVEAACAAALDRPASEAWALIQRAPAFDLTALLASMRRQTLRAGHQIQAGARSGQPAAVQSLEPPASPATNGKEAAAAQSFAEQPTTLPTMIAAPDLARLIKHPVGRVESFLRRFHTSHRDCRVEVDNPRKNEARYFYRTADFWPALQQKLQSWTRLTDD